MIREVFLDVTYAEDDEIMVVGKRERDKGQRRRQYRKGHGVALGYLARAWTKKVAGLVLIS